MQSANGEAGKHLANHVQRVQNETMQSAIVKSKKKSLRIARTSDTEVRRDTVSLLVLTGKQSANKIAKQFNVSVQTIYNDMALIRDQTRDALEVSPNGTRGEQILIDALTGTDERIRRLWVQIRENEGQKKSIIEGLRFGVGSDVPSVNADFAKAALVYDKNIRDALKQIRAEESHQAKLLQKFGVLTTKVNVDQKVTIRDETAIIDAMANAINVSIENPEERERLKNAIFKQLQAAAGPS